MIMYSKKLFKPKTDMIAWILNLLNWVSVEVDHVFQGRTNEMSSPFPMIFFGQSKVSSSRKSLIWSHNLF